MVINFKKRLVVFLQVERKNNNDVQYFIQIFTSVFFSCIVFISICIIHSAWNLRGILSQKIFLIKLNVLFPYFNLNRLSTSHYCF